MKIGNEINRKDINNPKPKCMEINIRKLFSCERETEHKNNDNLLQDKKAGMPIAIMLLVVATLVLVIFTLYSFNVSKNKFGNSIYMTGFLDDVYSKEAMINFYIKSIVENIESPSSAGDFASKFRQGLERYKNNGEYIAPELKQVEEQAVSENVKNENGEYSITLSLKIEDNVKISGEELMSASYVYTKSFVKG